MEGLLANKLLAAGMPLSVIVALWIIIYFLLNPEKFEILSSYFYKLLSYVNSRFQKKYVKYDLQGRINDFVKQLSKELPMASNGKFKIKYVGDEIEKGAFLEEGSVILRLKKEDPEDLNFVHGSYMYVSESMLRKSKRYISEPQKKAVDLFTCSKLIEKEKPRVIEYFVDNYLFPYTQDADSKVSSYLSEFSKISDANLYFPILIQELEYLGEKVFGKRKDTSIVAEVNKLIEILKDFSDRKIGQDDGDLNLIGSYCRFGIVIIGKPSKLEWSINPYVNYIRKNLESKNVETIYMLSRFENMQKVDDVAACFSVNYNVVKSKKIMQPMRHEEEKKFFECYLVVLRRKNINLIRAEIE